eukprot:1463893-Alexandrium_andersonii.AAC.1
MARAAWGLAGLRIAGHARTTELRLAKQNSRTKATGPMPIPLPMHRKARATHARSMRAAA